jgi:hypothetical protein
MRTKYLDELYFPELWSVKHIDFITYRYVDANGDISVDDQYAPTHQPSHCEPALLSASAASPPGVADNAESVPCAPETANMTI